MACEDFQVELSAWVDGESTGDERARLAAHLQTCPACAETLRVLQHNSLLLRTLTIPRAPASVTQPAMREVRTAGGGLSAPRMLRVRAPYPSAGIAAAGLAAAIAVAVFFGWHEFANGPSGSAVPAKPASAGAGPAKSGSFRLSSAQDEAALAAAPARSGYDFRDPNSHGRRDIGTFDARERFAWEHGAWRHEQRFGRDGWWWQVGGGWYWYEQPTAGPPPYVSEVRFAGDPAPNGQNPKNPTAASAPPQRP
jgi:hypothetical protein